MKQTIYYKKEQNQITIMNYCGASTLVLPKEIEGLPVTKIAEKAFSEEFVSSSQQPDEAFYTQQEYEWIHWQENMIVEKTNRLQKIVLPDTIEKIEKAAFYSCTALTQIDLPKHITIIPEECFAHCISLKEINLPDTITKIEPYAFHCCNKLEHILFPNTLRELGNYVFYNDASLSEITLPEGISVGMGVFKNCKKLKKVALEGNTAFLDVFADLEQEVELTITNMPKEQRGCTKAKLLFPDFEYEYMENYPARQFKQMNYGSGYLYHQCIHNSGIDFARYDDLFSLAQREETKTMALQIAINRLKYPYKLRPKNELEYKAFLKENILFAVKIFLKNINILSFLANIEGLFTSENIDSIVCIATKEKNIEATSFLLDYKRKKFGVTKKTFEL